MERRVLAATSSPFVRKANQGALSLSRAHCLCSTRQGQVELSAFRFSTGDMTGECCSQRRQQKTFQTFLVRFSIVRLELWKYFTIQEQNNLRTDWRFTKLILV